MIQQQIAIIGCGNLGQALAQGMIDAETITPENIHATRRNLDRLEHLKQQGVNVYSQNSAAVQKAEIIILTVKPYTVGAVLNSLQEVIDANRHIIISAATSVSLADLSEAADVACPVFRVMPNTAANVNESVTCISHRHASDEQVKLVEELFSCLGTTINIDEDHMEAATVLGACGIAYVMRFIRAMIQGGIQIGFDTKTASDIVYQTVLGAAELLIKRGEHPEHEIDKVTTPKGCTIEGLNEMEHNGFSSSLIKGIVASYKKIER